jgi:ATP-dependent Lhr-like helicase
MCTTKRGAHLALSLERLDLLLDRPAQRIGLSATVRPTEEVATFLGGHRPVTVVEPPAGKRIDVRVVVPVPDMAELGAEAGRGDEPGSGEQTRASIWPAVEGRILDLIGEHRSTIVFANSRRLAERLCARLNELAWERRHTGGPGEGEDGNAPTDDVVARAHHGSVSREERREIEEALKAGRLPAVVATSSLELGIDMGLVDLVIQVEAPPSVASGLQRVGRAGHQVEAVSSGVMFPKHRGDLLPCAVAAERMSSGQIEHMRYPRNPLDILAQHIVAMVAMDPWDVEALKAVLRRAAPFVSLPDSAFFAVLDMLSGRYPSDSFAELRPRLVWDRVAGTLSARPGAQRLAVTNGGAIPDRGLFGVFLVGGEEGSGTGSRGARRVGELDEEMVYESRVGDVFLLGSSSWRIEEITADRVLVSPAPGEPGRMPFWKGDAPGRPLELGRAIGTVVRELSALQPSAARERLVGSGLDAWAADNLLRYLDEQMQATGVVPDDRTLVVERFRDELGDWRVAVHCPFGTQVTAPWALALSTRLRDSTGLDVQAVHSDDGIVLRLPDMPDPPGPEELLPDPDLVEQVVTDHLHDSALFAARFRECAGRSLLLPRRDPGRRAPLWRQRQRAASLLQVAVDYPNFPVVLEAVRECLQDVFDMPGLVEVLRGVQDGRVRVVSVETPTPSPFARSLLFGYVGMFLYEGDAPLAERRAQALSVDTTVLAELLGRTDLRELLDDSVLHSVESELQGIDGRLRAYDAESTADLLRRVGDLTDAELLARGAEPDWLTRLESARRAVRVRVAGEDRWIGVEDCARYRDALGVALPVGVPQPFTEPVADPLADLVARYARTHGPFTAQECAGRLGAGTAVVESALRGLRARGRVTTGEFRPTGAGAEWVDSEVMGRIRRRSLALLRSEVEPTPQVALGRFLPAWQHLGPHRLRGYDGLLRAVTQLQGCPLPASALESQVLPARVADYQPALLDELCSAGEVVWAGAGSLPGRDGWIVLAPAEHAPEVLPPPDADGVRTPLHQQVLDALDGDQALFFRSLAARVRQHPQLPSGSRPGQPEPFDPADPPRDPSDSELLAAVWELVWAGWVSNDTLAPLRALLGRRESHRRPRRGTGRYARPRPVLGSRIAAGPGASPRAGAPDAPGRWSRLPERDPDPTRRALARTETLLDRHGIVTGGAVEAERAAGGFSAVYAVLRRLEESGFCRRGYYVEGLGAAQFALVGAADRLRAGSRDDQTGGQGRTEHETLVLAAADPANPYGAALPWPDRPETPGAAAQTGEGPVRAHRPGRTAGAVVVLVDGSLVLYVERGGRTLLTWSDHEAQLRVAAAALATAVREGHLGALSVERADGASVHAAGPAAEALEAAGFRPTPRGLRLRAQV